MEPKTDIATRRDIEDLISAFYQVAISDEEIGYIFTDIAQLDLAEHLPRIVDFWESVLLGANMYRGNPVLKHVHLHQLSPLRKEHFDRWLAIWNQTIRNNYAGDISNEAITKAKMMADLMLYKIAASADKGFVL